MILYLQEYIQPVGDLVLPCNTLKMFVSVTDNAVPAINQNKRTHRENKPDDMNAGVT